MPNPKYNEYMKPILILLNDGKLYSRKDIEIEMQKIFNLSDEIILEILPSGNQTIFKNRVSWAETYLKKANLIESPSRGIFKITESGKKFLSTNPKIIDKKILMQFEEFKLFQSRQGNTSSTISENLSDNLTDSPQDLIDKAYSQIYATLVDDLLNEITKQTPEFFEMLVLELLRKMGYGGSLPESCFLTSKSGDEGIDGVIKEDKLGFDKIYIQAKKWDQDKSIGRPEIQKFAGALQGQGASKGAFITTANFSKEAQDFTRKNNLAKIVLIDGQQLAKLMVENNVGVSMETIYEVKKIDSDFFSDLK